MKAILWKEVRENLKWAILGSIGFGAALVYSLNQLSRQYSMSYLINSGVMNCDNLSMVLLFGPIIVGFALGLLQILPELKRDQWAFLIHRPVRIKTIFLGKVVAGLLLYLGAMGLPFFLTAWWTALPGNYPAPFDFHVLLPGIADILCGGVFYLAGISVALKEARWFGAKLFPLLAACFCAMRVTDTDFFFVALLWIAFFTTLLGYLSCGMMTQGSRYSAQSKSIKFATILSLLFGAFTLSELVEVGYQKFGMRKYYWEYCSYQTYKQDLHGTLLIVTQYLGETKVSDLDGNPVFKDGKSKNFSYDDFIENGSLERKAISYNYRSGKEWLAQMQHFQSDRTNEQALLWYYVASEGVFQGFSQRTNLVEEVITPQGVQAPQEPVKEKFRNIHKALNTYSDPPLIWFDNQVVFADVEEKQVFHIFSNQPSQKILGTAAFKNRSRELSFSEKYSISVATNQGLEFFDTKGKSYLRSPWPVDRSIYGRVSCGKNTPLTHFYIWQDPWDYKIPGRYFTSIPINGDPPVTQWLPDLNNNMIRSITLADYFAITTDSPLIWAAKLLDRITKQIVEKDGWYWMVQGIQWHNVTPSLFYTFCAMLVGYFVMRKNQFSKRKTIGWCSFLFLAGPIGLIALLLARDWPIKIKCPSCGKPRRIDQSTCDFCKAHWPKPERDGTEIF